MCYEVRAAGHTSAVGRKLADPVSRECALKVGVLDDIQAQVRKLAQQRHEVVSFSQFLQTSSTFPSHGNSGDAVRCRQSENRSSGFQEVFEGVYMRVQHALDVAADVRLEA